MRNPKTDQALDRIQVLVFEVDGVFTDGQTWQDVGGQWRRTFSVRDTMGIRAVRKAGYRAVVLTPVLSGEIRSHFEQVGVDTFKDHCLDQTSAAQHILKACGLTLEQAAFVVEASTGHVELRVNGLPIYTSVRQGGDGAVLEICQLILQHALQTSSIRLKSGEL